MEEWAKPNDFTVVFRLTTKKYAELFLSEGSVKFSTPQTWIEYANEGRGDRFEGTFSFAHVQEPDSVMNLKRKYDPTDMLSPLKRPICIENIDDRICFKDTRSLVLPCYCFYILKHSMFECPSKAGKHRISATVPASYFRDFADDMLPEDVLTKNIEDRPSLIAIHDFDKFRERLYNALRKLGLRDSEILMNTVNYHDFEKYGSTGWMDFNTKFPYELFIERKRFEGQSEARVVVNTSDKEIIKKLDKPLLLGSMTDIAKTVDNYLYDGLDVEMTVTIDPA